MKRREKIIYFSLALVMYLLFRHGLGPWLGLQGWVLTLASYGFAVLLATLYLYKALLHPASVADESETQ